MNLEAIAATIFETEQELEWEDFPEHPLELWDSLDQDLRAFYLRLAIPVLALFEAPQPAAGREG